MALSSVQIANLALSKVGTDSTIESLTENSAEAKEVNLWFEHTRQQTLASFNWGFARKREALASHGDDPPNEWGSRYVYPSDCITARFIENPAGKTADPIPFEVEFSDNGTKSILTDEEEAVLIYTRDATEPTFYTPYFIEVFALLLAAHIVFALTGKVRMIEFLEDRARLMLIFAPAMDANEKQEAAPREADHIRGRA